MASVITSYSIHYTKLYEHVNYKKATPLGPELEVRGIIREVKNRKVVVEAQLIADGQVCVTGEVIAVEVPEDFGRQKD